MNSSEKEALFAELYQLDEPESDADVAPLSAFTKPKGKVSSKPATPARSKVSWTHQSLSRTVSAPLPSKNPLSQAEVINLTEDSPLRAPIIDTTKVRDATAMVKQPSISKSFPNNDTAKTKGPKAGGKRKRGQSLEALPASQKIFTGLSFCM